jgi:hypothetical protein
MHRDHARQPARRTGVQTSARSAWRDTVLTHINARPGRLDIVRSADLQKECGIMRNVGSFDRIARIVVGLLLIAFAIPLGFPQTGWNLIGWIGVVPVLTAVFGYCPAYSVFGMSTCAARQQS